MLCESLLELGRGFEFGLLGLCARSSDTACVATTLRSAFCFSLVEIGHNSLIMLLYYVLRNAFHAKDLNIKAGAVWQCIVDS